MNFLLLQILVFLLKLELCSDRKILEVATGGVHTHI